MEKFLYFLLLTVSFSQFSCKQENKTVDKVKIYDWRTITDDHMKWYTYTYYNIHLSQDFIGLDVDSATIDKPAFLDKLLKDKVFPFKIGRKEDRDVYKLYPLTSQDKSIKDVLNGMALLEIQHYNMEGTKMPAFSFTDINGNYYDNATTKGKILVLKCWFISCGACVKEFPELNKLVNKYKGNDNIQFISMAFDKKEKLVDFLKTKEFLYAVIPGMREFMSRDLGITQYPTHLLIDKTGKIAKVVNRIEDLEPFLEKASE